MDDKEMEKLDLDELDKLSGGEERWTTINGYFYLKDEKCSCGGGWYLVRDWSRPGGARLKCDSCGKFYD